MFKLEMLTDSAAFDANDMCEVARILRETADVLENEGKERGSLRDVNGNVIGSFTLTSDR